MFAPNSAHRAQLTPSKRGKGKKASTADATDDPAPGRHELGAASEARIQSFRVLLTPLAIIPVGHHRHRDLQDCGGPVKIIACIEDPVVIEKILRHL